MSEDYESPRIVLSGLPRLWALCCPPRYCCTSKQIVRCPKSQLVGTLIGVMERGGVVLQAKQTNEMKQEEKECCTRISLACHGLARSFPTFTSPTRMLGVGMYQLDYYPLGTQLTDCVNLSAQVHWNQNGNMCTYE